MKPMEISNEIVLRPRFKLTLNQSNEVALKSFEAAKKNQSDFLISRIDDHIYIKIPKKEQHFWSPQLHLEIAHQDENNSILHGFFSPNPTVWTLFMFLHFAIAILFIGLGIWIYTNSSLDKSYTLQLAGMFFLIICWIGLYAGGRIGKATGKKQMNELYQFMKETLKL